MPSNVPWGLLAFEGVLTLVNLACLATSIITLSDALRSYRRIRESGENHGADVYAWASVRSKASFVAVELLIVAMSVDRVWLLVDGYQTDLFGHFIAFGVCRTVIGLLVAVTAYVNMRAFARLRNAK
jgi:biopolymer transport protein ExbB/TolQ